MLKPWILEVVYLLNKKLLWFWALKLSRIFSSPTCTSLSPPILCFLSTTLFLLLIAYLHACICFWACRSCNKSKYNTLYDVEKITNLTQTRSKAQKTSNLTGAKVSFSLSQIHSTNSKAKPTVSKPPTTTIPRLEENGDAEEEPDYDEPSNTVEEDVEYGEEEADIAEDEPVAIGREDTQEVENDAELTVLQLEKQLAAARAKAQQSCKVCANHIYDLITYCHSFLSANY